MINAVPVELDRSPPWPPVSRMASSGSRRSWPRPPVTEEALLAEASRHLIDAGGKRFRATLVLLAAHFGDSRDERVVPAAAAIELTHLATLFHDDVMDEAAIRRGLPSANSRWSNTIAILTGDFLFARASSILAELGTEAIRIQAETFTRLVSGQVAETLGPRPGQDPLAHYLRVVEDKTASLIATAGQVRGDVRRRPRRRRGPDHRGLACAGRGVPAVRRHPGRGQRVGAVGQGARHRPARGRAQPAGAARARARPLAADAPVAGSPAAGDARLRELLSQDGLTDDSEHAEALALLRVHPAMDAARADLRRWSDAARTEIAGLPDVPARRAFEIMCDFVMERTS